MIKSGSYPFSKYGIIDLSDAKVIPFKSWGLFRELTNWVCTLKSISLQTLFAIVLKDHSYGLKLIF